MVTNIIALRRPIRSQTGLLTKPPIGCITWAKLAANFIKFERIQLRMQNKWTAYTTTTFERLSLALSRLDLMRCSPRSMMELQLTGSWQIVPSSKSWDFLPMLLKTYRMREFQCKFGKHVIFQKFRKPAAKLGEICQSLGPLSSFCRYLM